jgi:hypothetical protein
MGFLVNLWSYIKIGYINIMYVAVSLQTHVSLIFVNLLMPSNPNHIFFLVSSFCSWLMDLSVLHCSLLSSLVPKSQNLQ